MKTNIMMLSVVTLGLVLGGCTANGNTAPIKSPSKESAVSSQTTTNSTSTTATSAIQTTVPTIKLTIADAISAYEKAYPGTVITSINLDTSFGSYYFEVQGVDDTKEYELKINAETGEETKEREENLDADEANGAKKSEDALDLQDILTIDEATKFAAEALGVDVDSVVDWSVDRELTTTYWEVTFKSGRSEVSAKLNAQTGDILETELDD